jgi:hypothetical protein
MSSFRIVDFLFIFNAAFYIAHNLSSTVPFLRLLPPSVASFSITDDCNLVCYDLGGQIAD